MNAAIDIAFVAMSIGSPAVGSMLRIRPGVRAPRVNRVRRVSVMGFDESLLVVHDDFVRHRTSDHIRTDLEVPGDR